MYMWEEAQLISFLGMDVYAWGLFAAVGGYTAVVSTVAAEVWGGVRSVWGGSVAGASVKGVTPASRASIA